MQRITSCQNNKVLEVAKLKITKHRRNSKMFCAEGFKLTHELISCGFEIVYCFIHENCDFSKLPKQIDTNSVYVVNDSVMKKISDMSTRPEIVTVAKEKLSDSILNDDNFILALDAIQDPSNLGAILRSAEAFGVNTILLGEGCCDAFSPKTLRGAMGSVFRLNLITVNLLNVLNKYKNSGYDVIGAGLDRNYKTVDKLSQSEKKLLIIGNEGNGISKPVMDLCDFGIFIPMSGKNESLNAAVAASIIMWENKRQGNE